MTTQSHTLLFKSTLAAAMLELKVPHPGEAAVFIRQLYYWLNTNSGHRTKDGHKWIYNSYPDWTEQLASLTYWQFGRMFRRLRQLGMITSSCFAKLKPHLVDVPPVAWHQFNTTTWVKLEPERIYELTGCHPSGDLLRKPEFEQVSEDTQLDIPLTDDRIDENTDVEKNTRIEQSLKSAPGADMHICTSENTELHNGLYESASPSIYKENHLSHQKRENKNKENRKNYQNEESSPPSPVQQDSHGADTQKPKTRTTCQESHVDSSPGAISKVREKRTKQQSIAAPQEVWEIAAGKPYPVFLNWRADKHYKPQGGKWETDAYGNAYGEFYNNREKTSNVLFPQFMAEVKSIVERVNQAQHTDMTAANVLPSWFIESLPEPTLENAQQLMTNLQKVIDRGTHIALPNKADTPSSQTIAYTQAQSDSAIKPLPNLETPALPGTETKTEDLASVVARKQVMWQNIPRLRPNIKEWAASTPGVVVTEEGVMLAEAIAPQYASAREPAQIKVSSDDGTTVDLTHNMGCEPSFADTSHPAVQDDDPWRTSPALSLTPGQWVRFRNEYGDWFKGRIVAIHQEQGYFIKADISYWSYGKTRHDSIFRDDWIVRL